MKKKLNYTLRDYQELIIELSKDGEIDKNKIFDYFQFKKVRVIYNDGSKRIWDLPEWFVRRDKIIKNLLNKGLCKIKFLSK